jgi:hypothetical protein
MADLCGIEKDLTFHLARHTFATTVTLSNGVPIESVSKMLGHSKITTTQVYAKVIERKLSDDMQVLKQKLSNKSDRKFNNAANRMGDNINLPKRSQKMIRNNNHHRLISRRLNYCLTAGKGRRSIFWFLFGDK